MTREEAIKIMTWRLSLLRDYCAGSREIEAVEMAIEALEQPEIEEDVAQVVHAHWKDGCCTNCRTPKFVMKVVRGFDEVIYEYEGEANYCPHCGARMDIEQ